MRHTDSVSSHSETKSSTIMKFFIVQTIAVTVFLLTNRMVPANGGQSLADLLRSLIQEEGSAQLMQTATVESIDGRAQSFSLNMVGCDTITKRALHCLRCSLRRGDVHKVGPQCLSECAWYTDAVHWENERSIL